MMRRIVLAFSMLGMAAALAGPASGQVFTPSYQAPRPSNDVGIYLADGPGEFSVEALLRRNFGGYDIGLRGGIADTPEVSVILGADLRSPVSLGTAPIDVAFTAGIQTLLGDVTRFGLQGGLSFGHTFTPEGGFTITPYIHPRLGLIDNGAPAPADGMEAELLADIGFDFRMASGLVLRVGIPLSDPGAGWGIGLAWQ
jgi:hypothetical protein